MKRPIVAAAVLAFGVLTPTDGWRRENAPRLPVGRRITAGVAGAVISAVTCIAGPAGAAVQDSLVQLSPTPTTYVEGTDFMEVAGSAAGDITAPVYPLAGLPSGCQPEDFVGFPAGGIALIQSGTCSFSVKVANATAAGATGVLIFTESGNPDGTGPITGTLAPYSASVPVLSTSLAVGNDLRAGAATGRAIVRIITDGDAPTPPPASDEQIENLITEVEAMPLADGTKRDLTSKLESALAALDRGNARAACNTLAAFGNHVEAQSGKQLTDAQADALLSRVASVRASLHC